MGATALEKLEMYESDKFKEFNSNVLDENEDIISNEM